MPDLTGAAVSTSGVAKPGLKAALAIDGLRTLVLRFAAFIPPVT